MPSSKRYGRTGGLPGTLWRSCREAQETFTKAHQEAVQTYGEGDRADRAAFAVLKQKFEKRGDHWIAKRDPPG
jgi:hypothetical protein